MKTLLTLFLKLMIILISFFNGSCEKDRKIISSQNTIESSPLIESEPQFPTKTEDEIRL